VDEATATLPKGWRGRLDNLPPGDTQGVSGLCLDPHDLAIAKYAAGRDKDFLFNYQLIVRGLLDQARLLKLLAVTPVADTQRAQIVGRIAMDFKSASQDHSDTNKKA
jgi:hypothetical protein